MLNRDLFITSGLTICLLQFYNAKISGVEIYETIKSSDGSLQDKLVYSPGSFAIYSESNIHCGAICAVRKCPSYFYNRLSRKCQINDVTFDINSAATNELGWIFYFEEGLFYL